MACHIIGQTFQKNFLKMIGDFAASETVYEIAKASSDIKDFKKRVWEVVADQHVCRPMTEEQKESLKIRGKAKKAKSTSSKPKSKAKPASKAKSNKELKTLLGPRARGKGLSKHETKIDGYEAQKRTKKGAPEGFWLVPAINWAHARAKLEAGETISPSDLALTGEAAKNWPVKKLVQDDNGSASAVPTPYWATVDSLDASDLDTFPKRAAATKKGIPIMQLTDDQAFCMNIPLEPQVQVVDEIADAFADENCDSDDSMPSLHSDDEDEDEDRIDGFLPAERQAAATDIQRRFRGYRARQRVLELQAHEQSTDDSEDNAPLTDLKTKSDLPFPPFENCDDDTIDKTVIKAIELWAAKAQKDHDDATAAKKEKKIQQSWRRAKRKAKKENLSLKNPAALKDRLEQLNEFFGTALGIIRAGDSDESGSDSE